VRPYHAVASVVDDDGDVLVVSSIGQLVDPIRVSPSRMPLSPWRATTRWMLACIVSRSRSLPLPLHAGARSGRAHRDLQAAR
jgi:hypothetical protein